jgi:DNA adenine methylase
MKTTQLSFFDDDVTLTATQQKPVNVASVPQRSPFRYPGGKTWLVPTVREWLKQGPSKPNLLIEPFAGGGIVSLTAAFEDLAEHIVMSELDPEVAAVWQVILNGGNDRLAERIFHFDLTSENVRTELQKISQDVEQQAFCTILKNRVLHGGIITKGSGFIKDGENGKGIASRWYPKTLRDRIQGIKFISHKISFFQMDAFNLIEQHAQNPHAFFFIDPPYTVAGKRLYTYFDIDHEKLFALAAKLAGRFMLTYDDTDEIRHLSEKYGLKYKTIPMKTTHHLQKNEIIISDNIDW